MSGKAFDSYLEFQKCSRVRPDSCTLEKRRAGNGRVYDAMIVCISIVLIQLQDSDIAMLWFMVGIPSRLQSGIRSGGTITTLTSPLTLLSLLGCPTLIT